MDLRERILWTSRLPLRGAFAAGVALWVYLLMNALAQTRRDMDHFTAILFVGGGGLFLGWRGIRALEASMPFRWRRAAREAFRRDPALSESRSRKGVLPFLLGPDLERIHLYPWAQRLLILLDLLLREIFSSSTPSKLCQITMVQSLCLLEGGRAHWERGQGHGDETHAVCPNRTDLKDEAFLQYLLAILVLLSALFRLHLFTWGVPPPPFSRRTMGRLRRNWLPYCLLVPTSRTFPPAIPKDMEKSCQASRDETEGGLSQALAAWILLGESARMSQVLRGLFQGAHRG